jgi:1,4-alpha-glucan branching enzyme
MDSGELSRGTSMNEHPSHGKRRVDFVVDAEPGSVVHVGGTFNDWDCHADPLREGVTAGVFSGSCLIPPGRHEYKLHINGEWVLDRRNPCFCQNAFGSLNNVLEVR